jgi:hypothetical protein
MTFEYDARTRMAVDHERKIRLRLSTKFYDLDPDDFIFIYRDERMEFEFSAVEIMEVRERTFRGNPVAQKCPIVTYVIEPELRRALMSALAGCGNTRRHRWLIIWHVELTQFFQSC